MEISIVRRSSFWILLGFTFLAVGCKKLVQISPPPDQVADANVYTDDGTAIASLMGIYTEMGSQYGAFTGIRGISLLAGLSADELTLYNAVSSPFLVNSFKNSLSAVNEGPHTSQWNTFYKLIFQCNSICEGLHASNSLTPGVKQPLEGEAKFLRGLIYFYLVNLYGDVPMPLTTDFRVNTLLARIPRAQVYQQIIQDLKEAKELLSETYLDENLQPYLGDEQRVRPNKWAATALLARVYLFTGDYVNAESQSSEVINRSALYYLSALDDVFKLNTAEAIWQLQPVIDGHNTEDGWIFVIPESGLTTGGGVDDHPCYLSKQLLESFEEGDQRKSHWVDSVVVAGSAYYFPYKYKNANYGEPVVEYLTVLRLAEQHLIRAEARAQLGNISGSQSDLNAIRSRAGLPATYAADLTSLLNAIPHERQTELFAEWGHRWLDIKRIGAIDSIMEVTTPSKANGSPWQSYQQWYPIPINDVKDAPNLEQTEGY